MELPVNDPRRLASRVAARASLNAIRLLRVTASLHDPQPEAPGDPRLESDLYFQRVEADLFFKAAYSVQMQEGDSLGAAIDAEFIAEYNLPVDFDASEEEINAYGHTTVQLAIYPYLRELVQNLTGRMPLIPVTLDVLRIPLPPPAPGAPDAPALDARLADDSGQ